MVAFKATQIGSFIAKPNPRFSAFLVYGPDASLVAERCRDLVSSLSNSAEPAAEIIRLDDRDLGDDPDRLAVELQTGSMFAERRIVRVKAERRLKPEELKSLLASELMAQLVVEAGNLKPSSALRKLFEGTESAAALPCYADAARDIGAVIDAELSKLNVTLSREARSYLVSKLGADMGPARMECEKLALYAGEGGSLAIEDIDAIVGDMGASAVDSLANATAEGRRASALKQFDALQASGQSPQAVLATLSRHYQRLHRLCAAIEDGQTARAAIDKIRPPVHFKEKDALQAQCRKWNRAKAAKALESIQESTLTTRMHGQLEAERTQRLILKLCVMSG